MYIQGILNTTPIELIAGFGYLIGHLLLSQKKVAGWVVKIIGGSAWIVFLFQNENYIFMAVTVTVVLTMFYGWYKWASGLDNRRTLVDVVFEVLTVLVAVFMIARFVFIGIYQLAPILETFIVIAEITGTLLIARKNILGWPALILMGLMVATLVVFVNPNPAIILGLLELGSIYFYIQGIRNMHKKPITI